MACTPVCVDPSLRSVRLEQQLQAFRTSARKLTRCGEKTSGPQGLSTNLESQQAALPFRVDPALSTLYHYAFVGAATTIECLREALAAE